MFERGTLALGIFLLGLPTLRASRILEGFWASVRAGVAADRWLLAGMATGAVAALIFRSTPKGRFLDTLQHELAHLFAGLLLGADPSGLVAGRGTGLTRTEIGGPWSRSRRFLISVAPYVASPVVLVPLGLSLVAPLRGGWVRLVLGLLLGVALILPFLQINLKQSDLRRYGFVLPLAVSLWLALALGVVAIQLARTANWGVVATLYGNGWQTVWGMLP